MAGKKIILLDLRPLQTNYRSRGIGRYTRELAAAIYQQYPVQGMVAKTGIQLDLNIPILIYAPVWKRQWIWDMFILPFHLWFKGVTLFHNFVALGPLDSISYPVLFARKCLVTIHDLHMFHADASSINKFYRSTKRIQLQSYFLNFCRQIIAVSGSTKNQVFTEFGIQKNRLQVIPEGCDHVINWNTNEPLSDSFQSIITLPYILSIGDSYNKNLALGMLILKDLLKGRSDLTWVICGKEKSVKEQLNLDTLPGWISVIKPTDNELYQFYKSALLVLVSSTVEGFGLPVIEAAALGCPVVAGNLEAFKGHLPETSHLDPQDLTHESVTLWSRACHELINQESHRQAVIKKGQLHSEKFTWAAAAEKVIRLYP